MVKHFRELRVYREAVAGVRVALWLYITSSNQVREDAVEYEMTEGLTHPHTHKPGGKRHIRYNYLMKRRLTPQLGQNA